MPNPTPEALVALPDVWRERMEAADHFNIGGSYALRQCADELESALASREPAAPQLSDAAVTAVMEKMRGYDCFMFFSDETLRGCIRTWFAPAFHADTPDQPKAAPGAVEEAVRLLNESGYHDAADALASQPAPPSAPVGVEGRAREAVALALDEAGHPTEASNVRRGIDLDEYRVELSAARIAQQPAAEAVALTVCCGREECGGECGNEWRGMEWVRITQQPAAVDEATVKQRAREVLAALTPIGINESFALFAFRAIEAALASQHQEPAT